MPRDPRHVHLAPWRLGGLYRFADRPRKAASLVNLVAFNAVTETIYIWLTIQASVR